MMLFSLPLSGLIVVFVSTMAAPGELTSVGAGQGHRYEWRANTFTPGAQVQAALAVAPTGDIVTAWSSRRQQQGRAGVYAQRFDAEGVALGGETALGLWPYGHQTEPAIAADPRGNTWIVWQSYGQDGDAGAVIARRFDAALKRGSEIAVNQQTRGHQAQPVVAVSPQGTAVIVWTSATAPNEPMRVRGRVFAADGQPLSDEFGMDLAPPRTETTPSVAVAPDGSFAVVFSVFDEKMEPAGIRFQRFDAAGKRLGAEIAVSDPAKQTSIEPVTAISPAGYVVAWLDAESDGDDYGVLARRLDAQGHPLGDPFIVNSTRRGPQIGAALGVARDGGFAIAWNSKDGDDSGIFAQLFAADGTRRGTEFRINGRAQGQQAMNSAVGTQRLAFGARGELVCAWSGDADLGDKTSVNVTLLTPKAIDLAGRQQGVTEAMQPAGNAVAEAGGPEPHRPPVFDPNQIDHSPREIRRSGRFGFTAITSTGWIPPDPHLAVGPEHMVGMTNGAIAFFDKDGTKTYQQAIEGSSGFWGSVGATSFVFDPEVLYDEFSGRFFAMAAEAWAPPNQTRSYVLIAVSRTSNPNNVGWYKYRIDTTLLAGNLFDSPNIGVDADTVYITGDGFGVSANYPVYTFNKAPFLSGQPLTGQRFLTLPTSTQSAGIPPVSFDSPPAYYMIEHAEDVPATTVRLIALREPHGAPYFTTYTLTVPSYTAPERPPQKGTSVRPETFDARFWSVAYRNGSLWATHHVDSSRVRARWYEVAMNGWPASGNDPQLAQWGEIDPGPTVRTFFSAITVNARGDAAITCSRSSPTEYISMITAYRYRSDPAGTFRTPVTEATNTGPYSDSNQRWGDYGAIQVDPNNPNVFWAHHEYAFGNSWRTWVAQVLLPLRPGDMNCDGAVDFADINPFVLALAGQAAYAVQYPSCEWLNADCDHNGLVNFADINAFVALLTP